MLAFHRWAEKSRPGKAVVAETSQGRLDIAWLNITRNSQRRAEYPDAHRYNSISSADEMQQPTAYAADGYRSFGCVFPATSRFDYGQLTMLLRGLAVERIKGVFCTNRGWFLFNGSAGLVTETACPPSVDSRIEIIARQHHLQNISEALHRCRT